jgi:hypothetical protein
MRLDLVAAGKASQLIVGVDRDRVPVAAINFCLVWNPPGREQSEPVFVISRCAVSSPERPPARYHLSLKTPHTASPRNPDGDVGSGASSVRPSASGAPFSFYDSAVFCRLTSMVPADRARGGSAERFLRGRLSWRPRQFCRRGRYTDQSISLSNRAARGAGQIGGRF